MVRIKIRNRTSFNQCTEHLTLVMVTLDVGCVLMRDCQGAAQVVVGCFHPLPHSASRVLSRSQGETGWWAATLLVGDGQQT